MGDSERRLRRLPLCEQRRSLQLPLDDGRHSGQDGRKAAAGGRLRPVPQEKEKEQGEGIRQAPDLIGWRGGDRCGV